ncbi:MAG: tetratricopeptide repeat protein [Pseudomonadota bacterium]
MKSSNENSDFLSKALAEMNKSSPDVAVATSHLRMAIENGSAEAAYALATWYLHGKEPIIKKSRKKAIELLREASECGVASANFDLAVCYEIGHGLRKSEKKAFIHYLRAALLGDKDAAESIGRMYYHGIGVKRDRALAKVWLEEADRRRGARGSGDTSSGDDT